MERREERELREGESEEGVRWVVGLRGVSGAVNDAPQISRYFK